MKTELLITFNDNNIKEYDDDSILTFVCSENMTDSNLDVTPGICEQYLELSIYDRDNYLHDRVKNLKTMEAKIECFFYKDSDTKILLGTYYTSEWEVDGDNNIVKVKGRDKTYMLDTVSFEGISLANRSIKDLLTYFFDKWHNYAWEFLDEETELFCESVTVENSWLPADTLRNSLNKICYLGMLRMFFREEVFYVGRCFYGN